MKKYKNMNQYFQSALLAICCFCFQACEMDEIYHEYEHPFIRIVNQGNNAIWIEVLTPHGMEHSYGAEAIADTISYGESLEVAPYSMVLFGMDFWDSDEYEPFAARIFIADTCAPINIKAAREKYYQELYNTDSLSVIQALQDFEKKHLLLKKWYSKKELDSLNWTIIFPQQ